MIEMTLLGTPLVPPPVLTAEGVLVRDGFSKTPSVFGCAESTSPAGAGEAQGIAPGTPQRFGARICP